MSQIIGGHTFVPLERNIDDVKLNSITSGATITSELISTQTPTASAVTGDQFLVLKSGGTLARMLYDDLATSLGSASGMVGAITSVRLRTWNACGNPSFEVDQRNCYNFVGNIANNTFLQDRWQAQTTGTMKANAQAQKGLNIVLPGTSYSISQSYLSTVVATTEASLAAADYFIWTQNIEGPMWRELQNDVTSLSLLVQSSVAGLKFGVALRSSDFAASITHLFTIPSANTWTLLQWPNIPKPTSGSFPVLPGGIGYYLHIVLACGSTNTAAANDTWQAASVFGAPGMSNLFATAGASFTVAAIQHEPGSQCTTLIDKPFSQNYDECLRYYCKSYNYAIKAGTASGSGAIGTTAIASQNLWLPVRFYKSMAKAPTVTAYSDQSGAITAVRDGSASVDRAVSAYNDIGETGFAGCSLSTVNASPAIYTFHYTADTGW